MNKHSLCILARNIFFAPMVLFLLGATATHAELVQYTYTGTVSSAPDPITGVVSPAMDYAGIFTDTINSSGTVLNGGNFSTTLLIDLSRGSEINGSDYLQFIGDNGELSGLPAVVSATLAINGKTYDMNSSQQYGSSAVSPSPGGLYVHFLTADTWLNVKVFSSNLPLSLSTPVVFYSIANSDTSDGFFQIANSATGILAQGGLTPTSLTITSVVPLPATGALFLNSLAGLCIFFRKRA